MGSTTASGSRATHPSARSWVSRAAKRLRVALLSVIATALLAGGLGAPAAAIADDPAANAGAAAAEVILRKGDRGRAVAAVQRKLKITPDGVFGAQTQRMVKRFQRRRDLTADGIVGPITRRALQLRPFSRSSVVHPGETKRKRRSGGLRNLPAVLERIAECESGGDPEAVSPSGRYRGKYQFLRSTWEEWGGRGSDPAEASEVHQDRVALRLYRARGTAPWPTCGS